MMGLPHTTSFCWCFGLEVGTKLIGFGHLLVSLTMMIVCSLFASDTHGLVGTVEDGEDHIYTTWYKITVSMAIISVVHVLLACTLLYASFKRNTSLLLAWFVVMMILYVAALGYVTYSITFDLSDTETDIFLSLLEGIIFFGLLAYCCLCVTSFYLMLLNSKDMETPYKVDY